MHAGDMKPAFFQPMHIASRPNIDLIKSIFHTGSLRLVAKLLQRPLAMFSTKPGSKTLPFAHGAFTVCFLTLQPEKELPN